MRAAVDLVSKNAAETESRLARFRYIGGGEPTAEWRFLESTTRYIRERCGSDSVRHFIRLITNGTLLTEERVAWLASNIQFVTLSFDILPELQEARPYANGKPTHSKLLEVVRNLCAAGIRFHLRTTISAAGAGRLEEMVQYVHQNTGAKSIRFEPLSAIGRSVSTGLERPLEDV
ncbi:radical SAM protein, partial [Bradyrhizobium ottawaense]